ncbi:MAG: hypothetical protein KKB30_02220 [Proteobacteria bacterium]|nr:hypothetical protein [Pseudomonadota bacterium]MBU1715891.1 hypothetical protein [Pseudomonadota bacterium]
MKKKLLSLVLLGLVAGLMLSGCDSDEDIDVNIFANAGEDQIVATGSTVNLDGSASSNTFGGIEAYKWTLILPEGSSAELVNGATATPSFIPDVEGSYTVQLIVSNGINDSSPDTVIVTAIKGNIAPIANAGPDQIVATGHTVNLDGRASSDANNDLLTYRWTLSPPVYSSTSLMLTPPPDGSDAVLTGATTDTPSFIADIDGVYTAHLIVNDGAVNSGADPVFITALSGNIPPVANAGPDQLVATETTIHLDGSASFDANDDSLTYRWTLTAPIDSKAVLDDRTTTTPSFKSDIEGKYTVELVVNDGTLNSVADRVVITALSGNIPPVANAGPDQKVVTGSTIKFDGSASYDANGSILSYAWTITSRPAGSVTTLDLTSPVSPTLVADFNGIYIISLMVNDGSINSIADTVRITATTPATGLLDTTFGEGVGFVVHNNAASGEVEDIGNAISLDSTGRVYVTGYNRNTAGNLDMVLWRYTEDGVLDTTFGDGKGFAIHNNAAGGNDDDVSYAMALDSTERIYVTGYSRNNTGEADMVIWRYTDSGLLDPTFGNGHGFVIHNDAAGGDGDDMGYDITIDATGKIYVTGYSQNATQEADMAIWRYTDSGLLDTTFGNGAGYVAYNGAAGGNDVGRSIILDSTGRILITGAIYNDAAETDMVIWCYTDTGSLDSTFGDNSNGFTIHNSAAGGDGEDVGHAITLDSTGRIYIIGRSQNDAQIYDLVVWRYTKAGILDTTFDTDGFLIQPNPAGSNDENKGNDITIDPAGRIYVTGQSRNISPYSEMVIWRYNDTGILDTSFGGSNGFTVFNNTGDETNSYASNSITLDPDGKIYVTGYRKNTALESDMIIWKYK